MEKKKDTYDTLEDIMEKNYLDERLIAYGESDYYPFHMPGHKRQMIGFTDPYMIDITEIEGFDNLHDANEILRDAQQRAADLYGAKSSYFLINGSTCGILAAISASVKPGGKILIARNCHKAVYHAAYLRELSVEYVYPAINELGIQGKIVPEDIRQALKENNHIDAVVITSPTYDGIVSDISKIAEIVHAYGIPLIVDEAHGAHFGFHPDFPETAVRLGADIVIQSMHKTLPSLTQTALLHVCTSLVDEACIRRFLGIYQTSSPSYVLMAGMDRCLRMLCEKKDKIFSKYADRLADIRKQISIFTNKIEVLDPGASGDCYDPGKLLISGRKLGLSGKHLYDIFLDEYHLQMEMCSGSYVLAMTSFMDTDEGFCKLFGALVGIESKYGKISINQDDAQANHMIKNFIEKVYCRNEKKIELAKAWDMECEEVSLEDAVDRIAGNFVNLYPPGIPLLVPGERISAEMVGRLKECLYLGLNVQGMSENLFIKVVV